MAKNGKKGFFGEFKDFISRGNVMDMAVGVVIGGAFGKIVTGLVNYIINPCVSLITGGVDLSSVKTVLKEAVPATETAAEVPEVAILWGTWIQTIIDFITDAESANEAMHEWTELNHALTSKKELGVMWNQKIKSLGLTFDKETKQYVGAAPVAPEEGA